MNPVGEEKWNWGFIAALIFCVVVWLGIGYAAWHLKAVRGAIISVAYFVSEGELPAHDPR